MRPLPSFLLPILSLTLSYHFFALRPLAARLLSRLDPLFFSFTIVILQLYLLLPSFILPSLSPVLSSWTPLGRYRISFTHGGFLERLFR